MKRLITFLLALALTGCGAQAAPPALTALPADAPPLSVSAETEPVAGASSPAGDAALLPPAEGAALPETADPALPPIDAGPAERTVDPTRPMVALTFDDGPHATYTDQILDILEEHHAVATFFEVASKLGKDPEAVKRAAAMGCEIGSHSYRHANLGKMGAAALQADIAAADAAFTDVLGYAPTLLRPPYGSMNKTLKTTSSRALVTWSVDPEDWLVRDAEKVLTRIQSLPRLDGQVILLHSTYSSTVEATRALVPWLLEQGVQLVTVSELLTLRYGDTVDPNRVYGYTYFQTKLPPLSKAGAPAEAPVETIPAPAELPPAAPAEPTPATPAAKLTLAA